MNPRLTNMSFKSRDEGWWRSQALIRAAAVRAAPCRNKVEPRHSAGVMPEEASRRRRFSTRIQLHETEKEEGDRTGVMVVSGAAEQGGGASQA